jgi:hypothetical protein
MAMEVTAPFDDPSFERRGSRIEFGAGHGRK